MWWVSETNRKKKGGTPTRDLGKEGEGKRKERHSKTSDWNTHDGIRPQPGPVSSWNRRVQVCRRSSPPILVRPDRTMIKVSRDPSRATGYRHHHRTRRHGWRRFSVCWQSVNIFCPFSFVQKACVCVQIGENPLRRNGKKKKNQASFLFALMMGDLHSHPSCSSALMGCSGESDPRPTRKSSTKGRNPVRGRIDGVKNKKRKHKTTARSGKHPPPSAGGGPRTRRRTEERSLVPMRCWLPASEHAGKITTSVEKNTLGPLPKTTKKLGNNHTVSLKQNPPYLTRRCPEARLALALCPCVLELLLVIILDCP
ncbi:hypothetical protein LX36DRAFT_347035 [Colletotrichum falcatum]|nr:hypothetical protein LX36DRAFT_347035 [Colletotrichum falcatum]